MSKWADYLISRVRFNEADTHIVKVEVRADKDDKVGPPSEMSRQAVVDNIGKGYTFETIFENQDGSYKRGAKVMVITIDGVRYIKTRADNTKKDNLDNLPRF